MLMSWFVGLWVHPTGATWFPWKGRGTTGHMSNSFFLSVLLIHLKLSRWYWCNLLPFYVSFLMFVSRFWISVGKNWICLFRNYGEVLLTSWYHLPRISSTFFPDRKILPPRSIFQGLPPTRGVAFWMGKTTQIPPIDFHPKTSRQRTFRKKNKCKVWWVAGIGRMLLWRKQSQV